MDWKQYTGTFPVLTRDVDYMGTLRPASMLEMCQEVATIHSTGMGLSRETLLENHGIRVPEDMELVGFDHIMKYVAFPKPICTVDPNLQEEASIAIELIRRRIHEPALPPQQVTLPVSLTCYGTCARP